MILELEEKNFFDKVLKTNKVALIDFWAPWCGPCKVISILIEEIEKKYKDKNLLLGKVNVDNNQSLASEYQIKSIPTLIFFKNGKIIDKMIGLSSKETIIQKIDSLIIT